MSELGPYAEIESRYRHIDGRSMLATIVNVPAGARTERVLILMDRLPSGETTPVPLVRFNDARVVEEFGDFFVKASLAPRNDLEHRRIHAAFIAAQKTTARAA